VALAQVIDPMAAYAGWGSWWISVAMGAGSGSRGTVHGPGAGGGSGPGAPGS
jgi:hypothetical protein